MKALFPSREQYKVSLIESTKQIFNRIVEKYLPKHNNNIFDAEYDPNILHMAHFILSKYESNLPLELQKRFSQECGSTWSDLIAALLSEHANSNKKSILNNYDFFDLFEFNPPHNNHYDFVRDKYYEYVIKLSRENEKFIPATENLWYHQDQFFIGERENELKSSYMISMNNGVQGIYNSAPIDCYNKSEINGDEFFLDLDIDSKRVFRITSTYDELDSKNELVATYSQNEFMKAIDFFRGMLKVERFSNHYIVVEATFAQIIDIQSWLDPFENAAWSEAIKIIERFNIFTLDDVRLYHSWILSRLDLNELTAMQAKVLLAYEKIGIRPLTQPEVSYDFTSPEALELWESVESKLLVGRAPRDDNSIDISSLLTTISSLGVAYESEVKASAKRLGLAFESANPTLHDVEYHLCNKLNLTERERSSFGRIRMIRNRVLHDGRPNQGSAESMYNAFVDFQKVMAEKMPKRLPLD